MFGSPRVHEEQHQQRNTSPATSPAGKEQKTRQKLSHSMKANDEASPNGTTIISLDEEHKSSDTRVIRRNPSRAAPPGIAVPSNRKFVFADDSKRTKRGVAPRTPAKPRWIDENPEWENDWDDQQPLIYPFSGRNTAQITKADVPRLEDNDLLNDNLIVFYSRYLQLRLEKETPSVFKRTYIFNPWFYTQLSSAKKRGIDYDSVKSWTTKVDLFTHDFIVVPVNENMHWYLAIICYPGKLLPQNKDDDEDVMMIDGPPDMPPEPQPPVAPASSSATEAADEDIIMVESDVVTKQTPCPKQAVASKEQKSRVNLTSSNPGEPRVITFDSLGGAHSPTCTNLRDYLVQEAKHKRGVDITIPTRFGFTAKGIPEQNDFNSCGAYLLGYLDKFLQHPDMSVEQIVLKKGLFWEIDPGDVRVSIREAITQARKEQNARIKDEKEAKEARRRARVEARQANDNAAAIPSSPLPTPHTAGTMTSTKLQQTTEKDESDRLSRGNATSERAPVTLVSSQNSQGYTTEVGPATRASPGVTSSVVLHASSESSSRAASAAEVEPLPRVATGPHRSVKPDTCSSAFPATYTAKTDHAVSGASSRAQLDACPRLRSEPLGRHAHGVSTETVPGSDPSDVEEILDELTEAAVEPGPAGEPSRPCTPAIDRNVNEVCAAVIRGATPDDSYRDSHQASPEEDIRKHVWPNRFVDNITEAVTPCRFVPPLSSTPTHEPPSSPLAAHLHSTADARVIGAVRPLRHSSLSPELEDYTQLLRGNPIGSPGPTNVICLDGDDSSTFPNGTACNDMDDGKDTSEGYVTAPETTSEGPPPRLHSGTQQTQNRGKQSKGNEPIEIPDDSPSLENRITSIYFAPRKDVIETPKPGVFVGEQSVTGNNKKPNPYVHLKTTVELRGSESESESESEEAASMEMDAVRRQTVDLTNDD